MTNEAKRELADMVRRGLTVEQIVKRTTATKATVKRYIKALRPAGRFVTRSCRSCSVLVINNVVCHEAGCPTEYRRRNLRRQ
jgi:methionine aminopeptidase